MSSMPLESAYVLHIRPYRDTSLLVDLFTENYGKVVGIKRGARRAKSPVQGLLQPFVPIWVAWVGRSEMKTLTTVEPNKHANVVQGKALLSAMYVNELLMRLLGRGVSFPQLFTDYQQLLGELSCRALDDLAGLLRRFEKALLLALGYGLTLDKELHTGEPLCTEDYYRFDPEQGLTRVADTFGALANQQPCFLGKHVLALHQNDYTDVKVLQVAKQILYRALQLHLGNKPLNSWTLWRR